MDWGFEMNPYEPCCWNKMIKKEQLNVIFHVHDLKRSHNDKEQVSVIIAKWESVCNNRSNDST